MNRPNDSVIAWYLLEVQPTNRRDDSQVRVYREIFLVIPADDRVLDMTVFCT
jgi:hypothetical protein